MVTQKWRPAKAAFYTLDPGGAVFRLKAQFGFTRGDRLADRLGRNEPLVNQIYEHREPTFINNVNQAGRLADAMIQTTSTRMLIAPLYLDGRIMGLVDMRDKAGRVAFSHDDALEVAKALQAVELSATPVTLKYQQHFIGPWSTDTNYLVLEQIPGKAEDGHGETK